MITLIIGAVRYSVGSVQTIVFLHCCHPLNKENLMFKTTHKYNVEFSKLLNKPLYSDKSISGPLMVTDGACGSSNGQCIARYSPTRCLAVMTSPDL